MEAATTPNNSPLITLHNTPLASPNSLASKLIDKPVEQQHKPTATTTTTCLQLPLTGKKYERSWSEMTLPRIEISSGEFNVRHPSDGLSIVDPPVGGTVGVVGMTSSSSLKRARSLSPCTSNIRCSCYNCNVSALIMQSSQLSPAERSNFDTYFVRSLSHKFSNCSCYLLSQQLGPYETGGGPAAEPVESRACSLITNLDNKNKDKSSVTVTVTRTRSVTNLEDRNLEQNLCRRSCYSLTRRHSYPEAFTNCKHVVVNNDCCHSSSVPFDNNDHADVDYCTQHSTYRFPFACVLCNNGSYGTDTNRLCGGDDDDDSCSGSPISSSRVYVTKCKCYYRKSPHCPRIQTQRSFSSPDTRPSITQPAPTCTARRHRHSISGQMSYFKLLGYSINKKLTGSANSLFSTAVISGSSSAPNLRDMVPPHASAVAGKHLMIALFIINR